MNGAVRTAGKGTVLPTYALARLLSIRIFSFKPAIIVTSRVKIDDYLVSRYVNICTAKEATCSKQDCDIICGEDS